MTEETGTMPFWTRAWHAAYSRWFDHHDAGHRVRAYLWGSVADALVNRA